jgi:hypothetical protein
VCHSRRFFTISTKTASFSRLAQRRKAQRRKAQRRKAQRRKAQRRKEKSTKKKSTEKKSTKEIRRIKNTKKDFASNESASASASNPAYAGA